MPMICLSKSNGVKLKRRKDYFGCVPGKKPQQQWIIRIECLSQRSCGGNTHLLGPVKLDWAMKLKYAVRDNLAFLLQGNA